MRTDVERIILRQKREKRMGDEGVIVLTLNRGGEHWRIQLQLPSDPIEIDEAFAALDRISLDIGSTVIVDVDSNVQGLYDCLIDLDIMEPENFQKLQKLAGYTEGLSSTKEKLFSGVLYAESPQTIDDILALASHLDEYAMLAALEEKPKEPVFCVRLEAYLEQSVYRGRVYQERRFIF